MSDVRRQTADVRLFFLEIDDPPDFPGIGLLFFCGSRDNYLYF